MLLKTATASAGPTRCTKSTGKIAGISINAVRHRGSCHRSSLVLFLLDSTSCETVGAPYVLSQGRRIQHPPPEMQRRQRCPACPCLQLFAEAWTLLHSLQHTIA